MLMQELIKLKLEAQAGGVARTRLEGVHNFPRELEKVRRRRRDAVGIYRGARRADELADNCRVAVRLERRYSEL